MTGRNETHRVARALPAVLAAGVLALATGCGADFAPVELTTTGRPAAPLGQVVDLELSLPALLIQGTTERGVTLDLVLEIEGEGFGRLDARAVPGQARWGTGVAPVEMLSDGRTTVTITPDRWATGRIGPLRIGQTVFEVAVDGEPAGGGWSVRGRSWESQSGVFGSFAGWRRQRFLVTTTDFFAGGEVAEVAWVRGREIRVSGRLERVSPDPFLRRSGRAVFVLNRFSFDNVQRLDPTAAFATAWQRGLGARANPHDALELPDGRVLVTRYEPPYDDVAVLDGRSGANLGAIPLEQEAQNPDGTPRPDRMVAAGGVVFVGLQDIDRTFGRYEEGKLAVIDPLLEAVVGIVPLGGKNPGSMEARTGADGRERIWVALGGIFPGVLPQELSGGVVVVDVVNRAVERLALDDDDLGGNVGALALASERLGYVVVSDAAFENRVVAFDPERGEILRTVRQTRDFVPELEIGGSGILAVPDRAFAAPGLCLYRVPSDPAGEELPLGCAALPLSPFSVEALD